MSQNEEKLLVAKAAVELIQDGMIVGLGSGSTSALMVKELGKKLAEGLRITGVPTSENTKSLALSLNIPIAELHEVDHIDMTIDGADEFDAQMQLIKGGGGALLREKIIAHNSKYNVIIADSGKHVEKLGKFRLPIETIPFATAKILDELKSMGVDPILRKTNGKTFITDEQNYILDLDVYHINDLPKLEADLKSIPGIVETGLFLKSTDKIIVAEGDEVRVIGRK